MIPPLPWESCTNGHIVCPACKSKNSKCNECAIDLCKMTNQNLLALGMLKLNMNWHRVCPHSGCGIQVYWATYAKHMDTCAHKSVLCPLHVAHDVKCTWTGSPSLVQQHLATEHKAPVLQDGVLNANAPKGVVVKRKDQSDLYVYTTPLNIMVAYAEFVTVDTAFIGIYSLLKEPQLVEVRVRSPHYGYKSTTLLKVPSAIVHKPGVAPVDLIGDCMPNVAVPWDKKHVHETRVEIALQAESPYSVHA